LVLVSENDAEALVDDAQELVWVTGTVEHDEKELRKACLLAKGCVCMVSRFA
jgi:hypothetical protein